MIHTENYLYIDYDSCQELFMLRMIYTGFDLSAPLFASLSAFSFPFEK
jgi:hypothetical protein